MNEVKQSDIALAVTTMKNYYEQITQNKVVNLQEFVNAMEPVFIKTGYRTPPKVDEELNVLIVHDAGVGDFITQSGAIREIRRLYPDAHITLVVGQASLQLAEFCPYVNEIVVNHLNYSPVDFLSGFEWNLQFVPQLLTRRHHICYGFVHNPITAAMIYMSGAQQRISHLFAEGEETFLCQCNLPIRYGMNLCQTLVPLYEYGNHAVDTTFSLLERGLNAPISNREIEIWYTPVDYAVAKNLVGSASRPLYALVFGGNRMIKHYPPEKYAQVLMMILEEEPTATFVILGGGKNDVTSAQILKQNIDEKIFAEHVIDLTNKINYRQTAAVLSFCDMYIGNDTGALHAASAVKCPVLAVFPFPADLPAPSRTDTVRLFRPYRVPGVIVQPAHALLECARKKNEPYTPFGCRVLDKPHCIAQIQPETVFNGYEILKERIAQKNLQTLYIC